ncbi:MAG: AbrB/MazE/SpoVT family DNA-binding domain-containing protein [Deltaproteobacteria bacterium]|jgi:AbrB family looped-hinge helix DNA binding protein|nr:AbrB/MazE/SpoVT family DNA-binding domain-containing protein [Deltaproteobacteria bacterium]
MKTLKVLPKGQITLPKQVRKKLKIGVGDRLVIEEDEEKIVLKKGKTIFDYIGSLPTLGMSIEKMRDKAVAEAAKEND